MKASDISCAALALSGVAGVLIPNQVGAALGLPPSTARARAETRAGLGGTYAALGAWALATRNPVAKRAVGVAWLGAAAARLASLRVDPPETDVTYWAYLAAEVVFGIGGLTGRRERAARP